MTVPRPAPAVERVPPGFAIERDPDSGRRLWRCQECGEWRRPRPSGRQSPETMARVHATSEAHRVALTMNTLARSGRMALGFVFLEYSARYVLLHVDGVGALSRPMHHTEVADVIERVRDTRPQFTSAVHIQTFHGLPSLLDTIARALALSERTQLAWHLSLAQTRNDAPARPRAGTPVGRYLSASFVELALKEPAR